MHSVWEVVIALLAAAGALALVWLAFGRLLLPLGGRGQAPVWTVVRASGDGGGLEQAVHSLLWLRGTAREGYQIIIADDGLDEGGRAIALALAGREQGVCLCPLERLPEELRNST